MELRVIFFFDGDRKRVDPLISAFKALTKSIYQNGSIKIPKKKLKREGNPSAFYSIQDRQLTGHYKIIVFQYVKYVILDFSQATSNTSTSAI